MCTNRKHLPISLPLLWSGFQSMGISISFGCRNPVNLICPAGRLISVRWVFKGECLWRLTALIAVIMQAHAFLIPLLCAQGATWAAEKLLFSSKPDLSSQGSCWAFSSAPLTSTAFLFPSKKQRGAVATGISKAKGHLY